jgi:hypothetical protein
MWSENGSSFIVFNIYELPVMYFEIVRCCYILWILNCNFLSVEFQSILAFKLAHLVSVYKIIYRTYKVVLFT